MAEHKVPQNVEAEDKLLGPFSFRQFLYLLVALGAGTLAYFLGTMAIPLAFIPAPVVVLFMVLALPLRKDQPMETYLGAMIHFYFSPNRRIWDSDGQDLLVEITNPRTDDGPQTKDIGGAEAAQRLSFLTEVTDTRGWSTRGVLGVPNNTNLTDDLASAAMEVPDMLGDDTNVGRDIEGKLATEAQKRRDEIMAKISSNTTAQPAMQPAPASPQSFVHATPAAAPQPSPAAPVVSTLFQPTHIDETNDEKAIAEALRQSSQLSQPVYKQTVVNPNMAVVAPTLVAPAQQNPPAQVIEPSPSPSINDSESARIENVSANTVATTESVPLNESTKPIPTTEDRGAIFDDGEAEVTLH